jgi:hypothetical protein
MDGKSELLAPRARQNGLVVRELDDEVLVYDLERNEAHCLNQTAGLVWKHCDGETTISEMVELLRKDLGPAADEQVVWHALLQLGKDHLLEEQVSRPATAPVMTRRHMLQKVGVAVTAAAVTSIAVGGVAHAVSCPSGENSTTCPGGTVRCCPTGMNPGLCVSCTDTGALVCCHTNNTFACCSTGTVNCCTNQSGCLNGRCH